MSKDFRGATATCAPVCVCVLVSVRRKKTEKTTHQKLRKLRMNMVNSRSGKILVRFDHDL